MFNVFLLIYQLWNSLEILANIDNCSVFESPSIYQTITPPNR
jgi:hypothetical protein